jgi:outer membrane protein assembly factor BamB
MRLSPLCFLLLIFVAAGVLSAAPFIPVAGSEQQWPQAGGPHGNWSVEADSVPTKWSVARGEGLVWRTPLPETGQGGIAVWGNRVFLTILKPEEGKQPLGKDIVGYCLDALNGKVLWTVNLPGSATSVPAYFFSDATSPSPVTDGKHVWFFNACGSVGCYDFTGQQVWLREWQPTGGRPFNKQFEPILLGDTILNMEPRDETDPRREPKDPWNYLRGLDKNTGHTLWVADDALTHYNTPVLGVRADGTPAVLQGRGAYHGVPELPIGLSLTSLAPGSEGRTLWRYEPHRSKAAYTMHWNARYAAWFDIDASEHQVLDAATGKLLRTQSLLAPVDWRRFDPATGKYELLAGIDLSKQDPPLKVFPAQFCNIIVGDWHYFLCYTEAGKHLGPPYCVGRVNLDTGKVEYLELPVSVVRAVGQPDQFIWRKPQTSSTVNSRGIDVAADKRSQGDGWWWGYLGSPTAVGGKIFFTTMLGITYVIDGNAATLDEKALLSVNDLGEPGQAWSLNSISFAQGRLYHRSMKEIVCIGAK